MPLSAIPESPAVTQTAQERRGWFLLSALLAFLILRLWIMPLGSSLWLDETGTYSFVNCSLPELLGRMRLFPFVSSVYTPLAWAVVHAAGPSELLFRLPSVLAMALAAGLLYRLTARLSDRPTGYLAVLLFVSLDPVRFAAADAHPYALLLLAVTGSVLLLVRYLDSGRLADGIGCVLAAAAIPYIHGLATPVLGAHLAYALVRRRQGSPASRIRLLGAAGLLGLLLFSLLVRNAGVWERLSVHVFASRPNLPTLAAHLIPGLLVLGLLAGLAVAPLFLGKIVYQFPELPSSVAVLVVSWAVLPGLALFALSLATPLAVFVDRYAIASAPALAIALALLLRGIAPARARLFAAGGAMLLALAAFGQPRTLWPAHGKEDWRGALRVVRSLTSPDTPVLLQSGFVEADDARLRDNPSIRPLLEAPLGIYPSGGRVVLLTQSPRTSFIEPLARELACHPRFLLVARVPGAYTSWLEGRLQPSGFRARPLGDFGEIEVYLFERR